MTMFSTFQPLPPPAKPNKHKPFGRLAFTLAEVLITLTIIGVIAALTIPTLVKDYQKAQFRSGLKKAHTTLSNAFQLMSYDNGGEIYGTQFEGRTFKDLIKNYLKIEKYCGNEGWDGPSGFCSVYTGYYNFNRSSRIAQSYIDDGVYLLQDGTIIMIDNPYTGRNIFISVDVNGYNKGPNQFGYDVFTFEITNQGKFLPLGAPGTGQQSTNITLDTHCSRTSNSSANGLACAYKALSDPDYWKDLP